MFKATSWHRKHFKDSQTIAARLGPKQDMGKINLTSGEPDSIMYLWKAQEMVQANGMTDHVED